MIHQTRGILQHWRNSQNEYKSKSSENWNAIKSTSLWCSQNELWLHCISYSSVLIKTLFLCAILKAVWRASLFGAHLIRIQLSVFVREAQVESCQMLSWDMWPMNRHAPTEFFLLTYVIFHVFNDVHDVHEDFNFTTFNKITFGK